MRDPEDEARRWLAAAGEELAWSRHAAAGGFHAPACFHSQQAAEKAVKAVHYFRGARTVMGHNVRALLERLEPPISALDALLDGARELDLLYIPTRYPNGLASGTPGEAFSSSQSQRAIEHASAIVEAVTQVVETPPASRPEDTAEPAASSEASVDGVTTPDDQAGEETPEK